jgi:4-hydroxy-4-methyl-2-oxoglutarate aldolase
LNVPVADDTVADDTVATDALALGAATLGESGARRMHARVKPAWSGARVAGRVFPVRCSPGDNLAIHVAVTRAPAGSVLVADMGGERDFGYWGEVLTTGAEARGIAGLVIDACVRDCDALAAHGFPVFSTGLALTGASKVRPGSIDRPVTVGDVVVEPGDWVVGDVDGVVILPGAELDAVLAAGHARAAKEAALFETLRAGGTTVEEFGLDADLVEGA